MADSSLMITKAYTHRLLRSLYIKSFAAVNERGNRGQEDDALPAFFIILLQEFLDMCRIYNI